MYIYVRCLPPLYYIGEVNSGHDILNFNLIYTKFYADFRSGLRFGCYQRTISRYVIYLALSATLPSSVAFFLDRTSKVTTPQDRHILLRNFQILCAHTYRSKDRRRINMATRCRKVICSFILSPPLGTHPCRSYGCR